MFCGKIILEYCTRRRPNDQQQKGIRENNFIATIFWIGCDLKGFEQRLIWDFVSISLEHGKFFCNKKVIESVDRY